MDYQKYCAIIEEAVELAKRLYKLNKFVESDTFKELKEIERNMLIEQLEFMYNYLKVLHNRIRYYAALIERGR